MYWRRSSAVGSANKTTRSKRPGLRKNGGVKRRGLIRGRDRDNSLPARDAIKTIEQLLEAYLGLALPAIRRKRYGMAVFFQQTPGDFLVNSVIFGEQDAKIFRSSFGSKRVTSEQRGRSRADFLRPA